MSPPENKRGRLALYCNLFWLLFAVVTCEESLRLKLGGVTKPGSGFFPFCAGLVMLGLSLSALFQSFRKKADGEKEAGGETFRWLSIIIIVAAVVGFALTLETLGFLINTFLFITILLKVVQPQPWKTSIVGGLISAVVADILFNVIFRAQIPPGILGY
jgi:putative tricarboxylic transport membrane protein